MPNIIAGYRTMLGMTQTDMASNLGITRQAYALKENGSISFSDKEKMYIRDSLKVLFPDITIDEIFFTHNAKKYKEIR